MVDQSMDDQHAVEQEAVDGAPISEMVFNVVICVSILSFGSTDSLTMKDLLDVGLLSQSGHV